MKFNKKKLLIFGLLPLLMVGIVSAGLISYYGKVQQEITVNSPIVFDGESSTFTNVYSNTEVSGSSMTVTNNAPFDVDVKIDDNAPEGHIDVSYVGTLELTKKDTRTWQPVDLENTIEITYTVVGDTFEVDADLPEGYILVYAMDKENRFSNYATVMKVENVGSQNLPFADDWNAGLDDSEANYCGNAEGDNYLHCNGAKIWAIQQSDLGVETDTTGVYNVLWTNMANFYWETDLIEYNQEGQITVYPDEVLDFTPLYKLGNIQGLYTVTTSVEPVTA